MASAIDELIFNNSSFMDNISYSKTSKQILYECDKVYEKLKSQLNEEQIKLLDELVNLRIGLEAEESDCMLLFGFKTAVKLMAECL